MKTQPQCDSPLQKSVLEGVDICKSNIDRTLRITINAEMSREDVAVILGDLTSALSHK